MNRVLVGQAAAGLAAYLLARGRRRHPASVVIGYDGRHNSEVFARDTAELMAGAGVRAILLPRLLPTPVLAFAVRHLDASAGVMVTASHNPARRQRLQGVPRRRRRRLADRAARGRRDPGRDRAGRGRIDRRAAALHRLRDGARGASSTRTCARTAALATRPASRCGSSTRRCTASAGRPRARCSPRPASPRRSRSPRSSEPDPDFPTVAFPNPEEPGAMDLAFAAAARRRRRARHRQRPGCRPASPSACRDGDGGWRPALAATRSAGCSAGAPPAASATENIDHGTLACSLVSSPALGAIARQYRPRLRRDAHRLQVDLAGRRPALRLRGGARLPGRPRQGARQGRHLGRRRGARAVLRAEGVAARPSTSTSPRSPTVRRLRLRRRSRSGSSDLARHRRDDGAAARRTRPREVGGIRGRADRRLHRRLRHVPAERHPAPPPRRRRPRDRAPERHRAEAQVLPRHRRRPRARPPSGMAAAEAALAALDAGMRELLGG